MEFNSNFNLNKVYMLLMVCVLLLSACGVAPMNASVIPYGEISAVSSSTALNIMYNAVRGGANSLIMSNGVQYLIAQPLAQRGWAFIVVDARQVLSLSKFEMVTGGGQVVHAKTLGEFKDILTSQGWKVLVGSQIPNTLRCIIVESASGLVSTLGNTITTFVLVFPSATAEQFQLENYLASPEILPQ